jgi:hypothetical protein
LADISQVRARTFAACCGGTRERFVRGSGEQRTQDGAAPPAIELLERLRDARLIRRFTPSLTMNFARLSVVVAALTGVSELYSQSNNSAAVVAAAATSGNVSATSGQTVVTGVVTPATPRVPPGQPSEARVINLSTRGRVTPGNPLISGFAIKGEGTRTLLIRAVGPSLGVFGVTDPLPAPRLQIFGSDSRLMAENSGWAATPAGVAEIGSAIASAGAFPFSANSGKDAAVVITVSEGTYTLHVSDTGNTGGTTLAEIYDLSPAEGPRLTNVSTRSNVAANGDLISGFVVSGTAPRQFLVRGIGPGLAQFGISNFLATPGIALFDSSGRQLFGNDHWSTGPIVTSTVNGSSVTVATIISAASAVAASPFIAAANAVGAFGLDLGSADAALLITLVPGAYTVQLNNLAGGARGDGLLEIYEMP